MFKNKDAAAQVNEDLLAINTLLNYSLTRVREKCTPAEFRAYRSQVAKIMGGTILDTLAAVWRTHPDLMPQAFKDASKQIPKDDKR
jgi:hypothetical protein